MINISVVVSLDIYCGEEIAALMFPGFVYIGQFLIWAAAKSWRPHLDRYNMSLRLLTYVMMSLDTGFTSSMLQVQGGEYAYLVL